MPHAAMLGQLFCERFLGGDPEGVVLLQPFADGPVHADVVVHGMSLDWDCVRTWTGHGLTATVDIAWTPFDSFLASTRMIHLMLRG